VSIMPNSVETVKQVTLELDMAELRELLGGRVAATAGPVEPGFQRFVDVEPLLAVYHGKAGLTGIRVKLEDRRIDPAESKPPSADELRPVKDGTNEKRSQRPAIERLSLRGGNSLVS
jgi:hypothetical protein